MVAKRIVLSLLFAALLWGCAGSSPSVEKEGVKQEVKLERVLVKAGTAATDSLVFRLPPFARLFFEDVIDSLPGEYYYSKKEDRVDSLFRKVNDTYEPVAAVHFDPSQEKNYDYLLFKENNYWLVSKGIPRTSIEGMVAVNFATNRFQCYGNCVVKHYDEYGKLSKELLFPKYFNSFYSTGKLEYELSGTLYGGDTLQNDNGVENLFFKVENGTEREYYENGNLKTQTEVRNKKVIEQKTWNEYGTMDTESKMPEYFRSFYGNDNLKTELTGTLIKDEKEEVFVVNGFETAYYESGKVMGKAEFRNRKPISKKIWFESGNLKMELAYDSLEQVVQEKEWNEQGILIKDVNFPEYFKSFYDNGNLKSEWLGLYAVGGKEFGVENGSTKVYYENGENKSVVEYRNRKKISEKVWHESGFVARESFFDSLGLATVEKSWNDKGEVTGDFRFPDHLKLYYGSGKLQMEMKGTLRRSSVDENKLVLEKGTKKVFSEKGKLLLDEVVDNDSSFSRKVWNESGTLIQEVNRHKMNVFWDNGKIKMENEGLVDRDRDEDTLFHLSSSRYKRYFENGKIHQKGTFDKQVFALEEWNENGALVKKVESHGHVGMYRELFVNGNVKAELNGVLYKDDKDVFHVDSGSSVIYSESGKTLEQNQWKNKKVASHKRWNENGTLVMALSLDSLGQIAEEKDWNDAGILVKDVKGGEFIREFYPDGKTKTIFIGTFHTDKDLVCDVEDGTAKGFYENEKQQFFEVYKEGRLAEEKVWDEDGNLLKEVRYDSLGRIASGKEWTGNGVLKVDVLFPKYSKSSYNNGNIETEMAGELFYGENGEIALLNGTEKYYTEEGALKGFGLYENRVMREMEYKDGLSRIAAKWDEFGIMTDYNAWVNGTLRLSRYGVIDKNYEVIFGKENAFYENGKPMKHVAYRGYQIVSKKQWSESGSLIVDIKLPNYYKEYYDNGKLKQDAAGTIVEENGNFRVQDGVVKSYDENGRLEYSATYKDFEVVSENRH